MEEGPSPRKSWTHVCHLLLTVWPKWILTLSDTICYIHITDTLQLLGGPSEALYHAQALSTADHTHKLSLPLSAEVGWACTCAAALWTLTEQKEGRGQSGNLGDKNFDFSRSLLSTFQWTFHIWSKWTCKETNLLITNGPLIELLTSV